MAVHTSYAAPKSILSETFTSVTSLPTGWTEGVWNPQNATSFAFDTTKGAYAQGQGWRQNHLDYDLTGKTISSANGVVYTLNISTFSSETNQQTIFYLTSEDYSIVIGNSYSSNANVYVGITNGAIDSFHSFQSGSDRTVLTPLDAENGGISTNINVNTNLTYTLTLSAGTLGVTVTDANNHTFSHEYEIAESFNFTSLGFGIDGVGNNGIKSIAITSIPEPATATLSLLALAGLAARRRRK